MALVPEEYVWTAGTVVDEPEFEAPSDGHHLLVRLTLRVDRAGGSSYEQPIEARGATAKYLHDIGIELGDFVVAAGIVRTEEEPGALPYLLLRIVSAQTSEDA